MSLHAVPQRFDIARPETALGPVPLNQLEKKRLLPEQIPREHLQDIPAIK